MANNRTPTASSTAAVHLLTRFRAVDDQAARQTTDLLRVTAAAVATEPGHLTYDVFAVDGDPATLYVIETWASADDARRHADLVLSNGTVDRVLPLLAERLETVTLAPVASHAVTSTSDDLEGEAA